MCFCALSNSKQCAKRAYCIGSALAVGRIASWISANKTTREARLCVALAEGALRGMTFCARSTSALESTSRPKKVSHEQSSYVTFVRSLSEREEESRPPSKGGLRAMSSILNLWTNRRASRNAFFTDMAQHAGARFARRVFDSSVDTQWADEVRFAQWAFSPSSDARYPLLSARPTGFRTFRHADRVVRSVFRSAGP
jgi:hypothetical protein